MTRIAEPTYTGYVAALADATAVQLNHICGDLNDNQLPTDFGAVLPVNLQNTRYMGGNNVIQIGYWYKRATGYHFIYSDDGTGVVAKLDAFVGGPPVIGHTYRFKIALSGANDSTASFCVDDLTGTVGYLCRVATSPIGEPDFIWYGTEINDYNSPLGVVLGDGYISLHNMEYDPTGATPWKIAWPTACVQGVEHTSLPWKTANWACYPEDHSYTDDQLQVVTIP